MIWKLLQKFPKFALVFGVIAGSTALFAWWWFTHPAKKSISTKPSVAVEDTSLKTSLLESKYDHLILADNDLYNVDTGELIFKKWLKNGMPVRVFYSPKSKKIIAQYQRGFTRYSLDGQEEGSLAMKYRPAFSDDLKWALFVKNKDIWRADIDWDAMQFVNEKKITSIEQFNEPNFYDNIVLGTDKTLVVRNMNNLLRVNLENGEVKPVRIPGGNLDKRRSPDSKWLVGVENGQFFCYDVDNDTAKTIQIGRGAINDYFWLGNDKCVAVAAMKTAVLYDRLAHTLTELTSLPTQCFKLEAPSPSGRYIFAVGRNTGVLIDVQSKVANIVTGGAGVKWIGDNTFSFSRETPDSALRGTWIQTANQEEKQISPDPYLVTKNGGSILALTLGNTIIFQTKHGLSKINLNSVRMDAVNFLNLPIETVLGVQYWDGL